MNGGLQRQSADLLSRTMNTGFAGLKGKMEPPAGMIWCRKQRDLECWCNNLLLLCEDLGVGVVCVTHDGTRVQSGLWVFEGI